MATAAVSVPLLQNPRPGNEGRFEGAACSSPSRSLVNRIIAKRVGLTKVHTKPTLPTLPQHTLPLGPFDIDLEEG